MYRKMMLAFAAFAGLAGIAFATTGPTISAQVARWVRGATTVWTTTVNSANQLVFRENVAINANVLSLDDNTGTLILRTRTSAQIQALASPIGAIVFSSTLASLCFSSAAAEGTSGAWVLPSTGTTASIRTCF